MNYLHKILHNKFLLTATLISLAILVIVLILSAPRQSNMKDPVNSTTSTSQLRSELTNLSEEKRRNAIQYADLINDRLPFYLEDFPTTAGITTTIHVFHNPEDPAEFTRLEITGLSYVNKNELDATKNPNVAAFKESFQKATLLLREAGIDPKQLVFVYSDRDYVQATATHWVEKLGLLK